ncbi:DUF221 domain-containing protein [Cordyceps javanica]|uniref:DUF221 domain-containing protein n=1 Tax=Cordyceps javanica TaxID=43265 RepID=A0A545VK68_9HYPO|nr:DUF221 domain-containing protein [Cordyceps javanica]TQW02133.1 DUF221 domain protein [Cordyceps javanica]
MGAFISWINDALAKDPNQGSSQSNKSSSLSGMIWTLIPVVALSAVYFVIWLVARRSQTRFYEPRAYLGSLRPYQRSPALPKGWFDWIGPFWRLPDETALRHQSLDAYLFIRYLKVCTVIAFVSLCITWPILFPVNATGGGGLAELDILSFGNVDSKTHKNYYYAHCFVGWAVYGFIMYMITRELIFYVNIRNAFFNHPNYARRISARTVLFTNVPKDYLDERRLEAMYPGAIRNLWIAGHVKELEEEVKKRDETALKLEKGEVALIKNVNKARAKELKKNGGNAEEQTAVTRDAETGNIASRWVPDKKRPSHRLGFLGLLGKKVDTIEWGRSELRESIPKVQAAQDQYLAGNYTKVPAVFIEFNTQRQAQDAYQSVSHHTALHMEPKAIGVQPRDVIWKNLALPWWQLVIRRYAVYAAVTALIVFWAIPVAIIGVISSVNTIKSLPGLTWIGDIPPIILGVVSGLLPSVALAILMSLVPVFMRGFSHLAGAKTNTEAELFTQHAYFIFQVIQIFLVRTMTNAFADSIVTIAKDTSQILPALATNIPKASNFYISYFIVQGLTIAIGTLTQVVGLAVFRILYKYLSGTPRALFQKWTTLAGVLWGSLLPVYTNIVVIGITYSVIAPLMLFWSTLGLFLFYLAYRYNLIFVSETTVDTKGLIYPRALKQLFVGVYLGEICIFALFVLAKTPGPAVLMAIFVIFTILYNITLLKTFAPLLRGIPTSLEAETQLSAGHLGTAGTDAAIDDKNAEAGKIGTNGASASNGANGAHANGSSAAVPISAKPKGNILQRFLKPWIYSDYHVLQKLIPADDYDVNNEVSPEEASQAYLPPAAYQQVPHLWIPEDIAGVSKQEIAETSKVIPISDEGCTLDDKGNMHWDEDNARPPIYTEKPAY